MDWTVAFLAVFTLGLTGRALAYSFFVQPRSHASWVPAAGFILATAAAVFGPAWLVLGGIAVFALGEFYVQVIARG